MQNQKLPLGVMSISCIEIAIGLLSIIAISTSIMLGTSNRPINVTSFIYVTSFLSLALGIGLLVRNRQAYEMLIFLASTILVSKLLIATNIIQLHNGLTSAVSQQANTLISTLYHALLVFYLKSKHIRPLFVKEM